MKQNYFVMHMIVLMLYLVELNNKMDIQFYRYDKPLDDYYHYYLCLSMLYKSINLLKKINSFVFVFKEAFKLLFSLLVASRHERDQSLLVPVPERKKISSRSRREKILVPVPAGKRFRSRSRSLQKQILVPVPVKNILVTVPVQKKRFGPGPVRKKFWCRDRHHFVHL
jgi:hypothetical protein